MTEPQQRPTKICARITRQQFSNEYVYYSKFQEFNGYRSALMPDKSFINAPRRVPSSTETSRIRNSDYSSIH